MLSSDEHARMLALLERFDLLHYSESILAQASPCISMMLDDPQKGETQWPELPVGISKVGGVPDLAANGRWPMHKGHRAGFFLQIALAELPRTDWNPWPEHGMVYLFCHDDEGTYFNPPAWEMVYWNGPMEALKRAVVPAAPLILEVDFFELSISRRIRFRAGTDFPPGSQSDWYDFVYPLEELGRARGDGEVLDRYFAFAAAAADPDGETDLAKGRGPFFYPLGRLFGHTDKSMRQELLFHERGTPALARDWAHRKRHAAQLDQDGAAWRQLMRLESNPVTTYMSPCDAAPVYVMTKDPGTRPWVPNAKVYGLAAK